MAASNGLKLWESWALFAFFLFIFVGQYLLRSSEVDLIFYVSLLFLVVMFSFTVWRSILKIKERRR